MQLEYVKFDEKKSPTRVHILRALNLSPCADAASYVTLYLDIIPEQPLFKAGSLRFIT